jgi:hypothetical protein
MYVMEKLRLTKSVITVSITSLTPACTRNSDDEYRKE